MANELTWQGAPRGPTHHDDPAQLLAAISEELRGMAVPQGPPGTVAGGGGATDSPVPGGGATTAAWGGVAWSEEATATAEAERVRLLSRFGGASAVGRHGATAPRGSK